jgi:hypothetical protein
MQFIPQARQCMVQPSNDRSKEPQAEQKLRGIIMDTEAL